MRGNALHNRRKELFEQLNNLFRRRRKIAKNKGVSKRQAMREGVLISEIASVERQIRINSWATNKLS